MTTDVSTLAGGTATGYARNRYSLAAGIEGQEKFIVQLATGESWVDLTGGTATNFLLPLRRANDFLQLRYLNAGWRVIAANVASEYTASGVTTTAWQSIGNAHTVLLTPSTATGPYVNRWSVPADSEGAEKFIELAGATATGEFKLVLNAGTSTGDLVLIDGDSALLRYFDNRWWLINAGGATIATSTSTST